MGADYFFENHDLAIYRCSRCVFSYILVQKKFYPLSSYLKGLKLAKILTPKQLGWIPFYHLCLDFFSSLRRGKILTF